MWIKSNRIERIEEVNNATFVFVSGSTAPKVITCSCVLNKISDALKNGVQFLEVE